MDGFALFGAPLPVRRGYKAPPRPRGRPAGAPVPPAALPQALPHPDWLFHRLRVSGPAADLACFRAAAAGAGVVPWRLDYDRMEEDWFHLLVAPRPPLRRTISVAGARILARQMREAVWARHEEAASQVGHSRACPFDLHALLPVPPAILRLGPDDPAALAWLWAHWGTVWTLRHVAAERGDGFGCRFWAADWTPWPAIRALRQRFAALEFTVTPIYRPGEVTQRRRDVET